LGEDGLFRILFEAAAIGIALENIEGQPLFANPTLCFMFGFSEEEPCRKHCGEFYPPEDAEKDWSLFQLLWQGSIDNYRLEKRFFRKDGTLIWGRLSITLMKNDASPTPLVVANTKFGMIQTSPLAAPTSNPSHSVFRIH
jgi:PAS domain S-box-containing protein